MTYLQLKELSWEQLVDLLIKQARVYHDAPNYSSRIMQPYDPLPAPTLALLGDFEIRARFPDHRREELEKAPELKKEFPVTPCCNYAPINDVAYPVFWNPFNGVVQCHNCGHIYTPKPSAPADNYAAEAAKYHELLFAVARAFPGESRHQTALRYILEAEANATCPEADACDCKP